MNVRKKLMGLSLAVLCSISPSLCQTSEVTQLLLNVEKLSQFREILRQMHDGYRILKGGYQSVKDIAEGNFSLHQTFLDGLLAVRPAVRNYRRVGEIIDYQIRLVRAHRNAVNRLGVSGLLQNDELKYLMGVYGRLLKQSLSNLDELVQVITASHLRMNDEERLAAIDRVYEGMQDKLLFFKEFNTQAMLLIVQREREAQDLDKIGRLYGMEKK